MVQKPLVLFVDDETHIRTLLRDFLESNGYRVHLAANVKDGVQKLEENAYAIVITDLRLGEESGMDVLREARSKPYDPEVVLVTAYGSIESAVEAMKHGAFEYLTKPFDTGRVLVVLEQALERRQLKQGMVIVHSQPQGTRQKRKIIAASSSMRRILDLVDTVAQTDSSVLIQGESGTGKDLIAWALHERSPRASRPFVVVNCAAIPEALFESEFFGHAKGAFTGAVQEKKGLVEEADGGTLMLDEIGDMPLTVQPKLLRVLEKGEIRKVGRNTPRYVDVRVVAVTNRDLAALVKAGTFRNDLFYRLNVIPITIPPLRERKEDILPLATHFLEVFQKRMKKEIKGFSKEAVGVLLELDLPGNVRELENMVQRAVAVCRVNCLSVADLVFASPDRNYWQGRSAQEGGSLRLAAVNEISTRKRVLTEKEHIRMVLNKTNWNQSQAARELGISRTTLWAKIKKYGISKSLD